MIRNCHTGKETLHLLHELAEDAANDDLSGDHLRRIQLRGGVPYWYMYKKHFQSCGASRLYLWYEKVWNPIAPMPMPSIELPVPSPNRQDLYLSFHICLRSHETCILL